jgi:2-polyprenyl-3-methyl-5-hydroxy-6-metoxy-1,4-benzoquinol methylase
MPTSNPSAISYIAQRIRSLQPQSILDIGIGCGKWGFIAREYADTEFLCNLNPVSRLQLDGIEIFPAYIGSIQKMLYNNIYIGNASLVINEISTTYDLIIMGDVIEHFTKDDGISLLNKIKKKSKKSLIITPNYWIEQGSVHGNIYETHLSLWTKKDLEAFGKVTSVGIFFVLEM